MNIKVVGLLILGALINLGSAKAIAAEPEPEFNCQNKVIVEQVQGPHWNNLGKVISQHLVFMAEHLKNGNILSAGPLVSDKGEPLGGVAIYNLSDKQKAEDIAKTDPFITEGVATLVIRPWVQCVLK